MTYILIGCFGFLAIHLFDIVSLKRVLAIKPCSWFLGNCLLGYSLIMVSVQSNKLAMPSWVNWPGWLLLFLSIFLQIYAVFINLPFRKTYITTGFSDKLVTKGLYALVRHPGVPLFALFLLSLFLVAKSTLLLIAAPLFIFLDVTLVIIEDNFFFGRMFAGYDSYRKQTPMLVPNRQSAIAFINSLRQAKA